MPASLARARLGFTRNGLMRGEVGMGLRRGEGELIRGVGGRLGVTMEVGLWRD